MFSFSVFDGGYLMLDDFVPVCTESLVAVALKPTPTMIPVQSNCQTVVQVSKAKWNEVTHLYLVWHFSFCREIRTTAWRLLSQLIPCVEKNTLVFFVTEILLFPTRRQYVVRLFCKLLQLIVKDCVLLFVVSVAYHQTVYKDKDVQRYILPYTIIYCTYDLSEFITATQHTTQHVLMFDEFT